MKDKVMSGSRTAKKCQECRNKYDCKNKKLEAFNYIVPKETEVKINLSVNVNNLDMDEIAKQIEKNLIKAYCR